MKNTIINALLFWGIAILVVGGRFFVQGRNPSPAISYEAFAHIWCGFMLAGIVWRKGERVKYGLVLATASLFELVMFLTR